MGISLQTGLGGRVGGGAQFSGSAFNPPPAAASPVATANGAAGMGVSATGMPISKRLGEGNHAALFALISLGVLAFIYYSLPKG